MQQMNRAMYPAAGSPGFNPAALNNAAAAQQMAAAAAAAMAGTSSPPRPPPAAAAAAATARANSEGGAADDASFRGILTKMVHAASQNYNGAATEGIVKLAGRLAHMHEVVEGERKQLQERCLQERLIASGHEENLKKEQGEVGALQRRCAELEAGKQALEEEAERARSFMVRGKRKTGGERMDGMEWSGWFPLRRRRRRRSC
jgi:hypothetical protein